MIPLLSNVFSTPGHFLEEYDFSLECPRCGHRCCVGQIRSTEKDGCRTYKCPVCSGAVAMVSDPAVVAMSGDSYLISGWAVRPFATLLIALEVSAIRVPVRRGNLQAQTRFTPDRLRVAA
jgi:hypothetical protein